jgi:hypothetical protein
MAIKAKNIKINIGGTKYKINENVYKYIVNVTNVLQLHEIAMLGWIKNCVRGEDKAYQKEFTDYIISIPHAEETISKMVEADEKVNQEISDKKEKVKE